MCDPVSLVVGAVGGLLGAKALSPRQQGQTAASLSDPAAENAQAEAEAAQRANARLATDQRRRREQGSLLARGAPQATFGDGTSGSVVDGSPLSAGTAGVTRSTAGRSSSLIARGAAVAGGGSGGAGTMRRSAM